MWHLVICCRPFLVIASVLPAGFVHVLLRSRLRINVGGGAHHRLQEDFGKEAQQTDVI